MKYMWYVIYDYWEGVIWNCDSTQSLSLSNKGMTNQDENFDLSFFLLKRDKDDLESISYNISLWLSGYSVNYINF